MPRARRLQFGLRLLVRTDARRRRGAAIMIDQVAEGARADIVGPDEAQPVETLLFAQSHSRAQRRPRPLPREHRPAGGALQPGLADYNPGSGETPIFPSLPLSRRPILARCMTHNSALSSRNNAAALGWPRPHNANGISALATKAASEE